MVRNYLCRGEYGIITSTTEREVGEIHKIERYTTDQSRL